MTVKEFLFQVKKNLIIIERKKLNLEKMKNLLEYKTQPIDDMPHSPSDPENRSKSLNAYLVLEEETNKEIEKLIEHNNKAEEMINSLNDSNVIALFYFRYFDGYSWNRIVEKMGYSRTWIHENHGRGLQKIRKVYGDNIESEQK